MDTQMGQDSRSSVTKMIKDKTNVTDEQAKDLEIGFRKYISKKRDLFYPT
jgi:hypothetical protein